MYEYFIIQNSLYFIKDNEFINGNYFSLISNDIYKYFYELAKNPSQEQFSIFQLGFQKLKNGGDIIYLLCKKICGKLNMGEYDLFFFNYNKGKYF